MPQHPPRQLAAAAPALTFVSHGVTIAVRSNDDAVLRCVAALLPTGGRRITATAADVAYTWTVATVGSATVHSVTVRCRRQRRSTTVARTTELSHALASLNHDADFRIAMHAPEDVFVHAGVVSWHGRALVFPGHSFAGKTTLVAELVRQGACYCSDEYAVLDASGRVLPFPRPLQLRGRRNPMTTVVTPEELGGRREVAALRIGAVIVARFSPGAAWAPRVMTAGEAVLSLLAHAVDVRARPDYVLQRVVHCARGDVTALTGERGEADVMAREILRRFAPSRAPRSRSRRSIA